MLTRDEYINSNWGTICTLLEMKAADGKASKLKAYDRIVHLKMKFIV
jgi:hypothetical protein